MFNFADFFYLHFMKFLNAFMLKIYFNPFTIRKKFLTVRPFNYNEINIALPKVKHCAILEACEGNVATSCWYRLK